MDLLSDLCRVWTCPAGGANQAVPVRPALFITHSQRWPVTLVRKELPRGDAATTDGPKTPAQRHDQIKLRGIETRPRPAARPNARPVGSRARVVRRGSGRRTGRGVGSRAIPDTA